MEIILASKNKGKIREIERIIQAPNLKLILLDDIDQKIPEIEEWGKDYIENAIIKAKTVAKLTNKNTIADDSGLELKFLKGEPGPKSARFPSGECSDEERCKHILSLLEYENPAQRKAKFVCVMVLYFISGETLITRGECKGSISQEMKGHNGFGYDPIFIPRGFNKTFAELNQSIKNEISHRYNAIKDLKLLLSNYLKDADKPE